MTTAIAKAQNAFNSGFAKAGDKVDCLVGGSHMDNLDPNTLKTCTGATIRPSICCRRLRWFPSWTGQGTEPASKWRVDGDEGVSAVDGEAEG